MPRRRPEAADDALRNPGRRRSRFPIYAWLALTLRSLLPQVEKIGAATAAEIDIDTLEDRLRNAVTAVHGEALCPLQFCGWTKL